MVYQWHFFIPENAVSPIQLLGLLDVKNSAEYGEKLTNESGALAAMKNAERFFRWVKEILKE